jgi:hypothetical protein
MIKSFEEFINEGNDITSADVAKAFKKVLTKYNWGNFRFDMGDFEVATEGGDEDDYNEEDDSATMTVYANSDPAFKFLYKGDDFKLLKVYNKIKAKIILNNLASGSWAEPKKD